MHIHSQTKVADEQNLEGTLRFSHGDSKLCKLGLFSLLELWKCHLNVEIIILGKPVSKR